MDVNITRNSMRLDKELNELDLLAVDFAKVLEKNRISYALVSGYVAILFGRNRSSEDIDMLAKRMSERRFLNLWESLKKNFTCITTNDPKNAYKNYLMANTAIRFSRKGQFIPNMELKFPKMDLDEWVIKHAKKVILKNHTMRISPIELQISYKLLLGSNKDIEDARYLYNIFKETLDTGLLKQFLKNLDKEDRYSKYIETAKN